jgi:hypothetical protein
MKKTSHGTRRARRRDQLVMLACLCGPARCCGEISASASRRNDTDRRLARSVWESVPAMSERQRVEGLQAVGEGLPLQAKAKYTALLCIKFFTFATRAKPRKRVTLGDDARSFFGFLPGDRQGTPCRYASKSDYRVQLESPRLCL